MTWTPVRNFFAICPIGSSFVAISGDDFAYIVERRQILESLPGGVKFAIHWGLDGAPVTRDQARKMLTAVTEDVEVDGLEEFETIVDGKARKESRPIKRTEQRTRPPAEPRALRPEARPGPPPVRFELPPLVDEFGWRIDGRPSNGAASAKPQQNCCRSCACVADRGLHATGALGDPFTDPDPPGYEPPPPARHDRAEGV